MSRMFTFDPARYAADFAAREYVHISQGLTEEFYHVMCRQVEEYLQDLMKQFAIGDKQQALYRFPDEHDYLGEFLTTVGGVCGLDPARLVISERHIKAYEANADPAPLAHKDRFATEVAVGFSVRVPPGSTLVLYPDAEREINPFNSSTEYRASLRPEQLPEKTLREARRLEIQDAPRDVVMFHGRSIWHLRARPAGTVMLYFKLNALNADPLGEDPASPGFRSRTLSLLAAPDAQLLEAVPLLGRRIDSVQRRYNQSWQEVVGVALYGERPVMIDEQQFKALRAIDGQRSLRSVVQTVVGEAGQPDLLRKLRWLVERGVIDLLPASTAGHDRGAAEPVLVAPGAVCRRV